MLIAALITKAKTRKKPESPVTNTYTYLINSIIYNGIVLSHQKMSNAICSNMDGSKIIILDEVSQIKKDRYDITCV